MQLAAKVLNLQSELDRAMIHEVPEHATVYCLTMNTFDLFQAKELEEQIWKQKGYGSAKINRKYDNQSSVFVAKDMTNGDVIGLLRLFHKGQYELPFLSEMNYDDVRRKATIIEGVDQGHIEEVGVLLRDRHRTASTETAVNLSRLAYRHAVERGVTHWAMVMEPRRAKIMNRYRGYSFRQLGKPKYYQGGECAAHIMRLQMVRFKMRVFKPKLYKWFTQEPLSGEIYA